MQPTTVVPKEVSEIFFCVFLLIFFYWCVVRSRFLYRRKKVGQTNLSDTKKNVTLYTFSQSGKISNLENLNKIIVFRKKKAYLKRCYFDSKWRNVCYLGAVFNNSNSVSRHPNRINIAWSFLYIPSLIVFTNDFQSSACNNELKAAKLGYWSLRIYQ